MPLFRAALLVALAVTCHLAVPVVLAEFRSAKMPGPGQGQPDQGHAVIAGLADGACVAFEPAGGRYSKTVFIDPGHGGLDPGVVGSASGRQVLEKTVALNVATRLGQLLRSDGYRVVLSRTGDTSVIKLADSDSVDGAMTASAVHRDLLTRAACANAANASALLSIHFDAFGDPSVGGTETFYDAARSFANDSKRLASEMQTALVAALGTSDRGIWTDDQLVAPTLTSSGATYGHLIELGPAEPGYVDDPSMMPGALVEPLFLTNVAEARLAGSESGQQRIAAALRDGLEKYLTGS